MEVASFGTGASCTVSTVRFEPLLRVPFGPGLDAATRCSAAAAACRLWATALICSTRAACCGDLAAREAGVPCPPAGPANMAPLVAPAAVEAESIEVDGGGAAPGCAPKR